MKATEKQKSVLKSISSQLYWMGSSNDITSPTHYHDIEDCMTADLEETVDKETLELLVDKVQELYTIIKNIK